MVVGTIMGRRLGGDILFQEAVGYKLQSRVRVSLESIVQYPFHMHTNVIEIICVVDGSISISDSA